MSNNNFNMGDEIPSFHPRLNDENHGGIQHGHDQFATEESPSFHTPHPNRGQNPAQFKVQEFYTFMENQLIESVKASLNHELYSNATFLCERLHAQKQNEDVKHLLAQCYLGEDKPYKAYEILKDCQSAKNRYKFALTCIKMKKYQDAEKALMGADLPQFQTDLSNFSQSVSQNRFVPNGASGYYLLGFVLEKQFKKVPAIECYEKALQLQPTLWCAFERLCKMVGGPESSNNKVNAVTLFSQQNADIQSMNDMIKDHMINIQQHAIAASGHQATQFNINVNNFDASPVPNSGENKAPMHQYPIFGTNQKTPAPHKQNFCKEQAALDLADRIAGAPQKINDDDSIDTKFDHQHGSGGLNEFLKTPTQYITPKTTQGNNGNPSLNGPMGKSRLQNQSGIQAIPVPQQLQFDSSAQKDDEPLGIRGGASSGITRSIGAGLAHESNNEIDYHMPLSNTVNRQHMGGSNAQKGGANNQKYSYTSFFNQQNVIGDPIVKPFTISTPNQNISNNQNFNIAQSAEKESDDGQISASKGIGAHLLQIQQSQFKQNLRIQKQQTTDHQSDLIYLLRQLGIAYQLQADFNCEEAVREYKKLSGKQFMTGWVSQQIAKCHFEMAQYQEAQVWYDTMMKQEPYRLEGLEYYSTCLWHLKKQTDLVYWSKYAMDRCLYSPETWCILGNCYALQKEHETALKYFSKAIQIDKYFSYAHTLCGHEYVDNENFEQARKCYQEAINCDERHHNAWWGLGNIYQKQENYENATMNFKQAIKINKQSAVLHTYLGMNYHYQDLIGQALDEFDVACKLDPKNRMNKYQKVLLLMSMNKPERDQDALDLLLQMNKDGPKEPPIYINIGKIYKKQGNLKEALKYFNCALNLDPKDINQVKSLIDRIHQSQDYPDEAEDAEFS